MKIMVISDTHGDVYYLNKVIQTFYEQGYNKLYHLGDIGRESIKLLNPLSDKIKAVKGNNDFFLENAKFKCDSYIELDYVFNKVIVLTHGHYYSPYSYNGKYDIFLYGHTHTGLIHKVGNQIIACPGSISLPRDNYNSYIEINEKSIKLVDVETSKVIKQELL